MASYSTTIAAIALRVERKRLENLLGRCRIPGTSQGRQGRARRLSQSSLLAVAAVLRLQHVLGIPASRAVELIADGLLSEPGDRSASLAAADDPPGGPDGAAGGLHRGPFLLAADVNQLKRELADSLAEAMEMGPRPRRGRPPGTGRQNRG
jgi:hypothetical protein